MATGQAVGGGAPGQTPCPAALGAGGLGPVHVTLVAWWPWGAWTTSVEGLAQIPRCRALGDGYPCPQVHLHAGCPGEADGRALDQAWIEFVYPRQVN